MNRSTMNSSRRNAAATFPVAAAGLVFAALAISSSSPAAAAEGLIDQLGQVPFNIVHEAYRDGNWDLFEIRADGSGAVNLTGTSGADELYPHVSPDGTKICFLAFEEEGGTKIRNIYLMNRDGSGRTLVAKNARWPCWKADSGAIAYLKNELDELSFGDSATTGLFIYDLSSGDHTRHPNKEIQHIYAICWSPDGKWFLATVSGGMGYKHAILAIEADGTRVHEVDMRGCRPDFSPDGRRVVWNRGDYILRVADLDLSGPVPVVTNKRDVFTSDKSNMIYHMDWSPEGKYIAFSRGPGTKRLGRHPAIIGIRVDGWSLCIADALATDRWVTLATGDTCAKEPDWAPAGKGQE